MPREVKDIQFNSRYNNCDARMSILKNETVSRDLNYKELEPQDIDINSYIYVEDNGEPYKLKLASVIDEKQGVQSDWAEENKESLAYIKNKPPYELEEDLVSSYTVGGIKAGDVIEAGTSLLDIIKKILNIAESAIIKFGVLDSVDEINPLMLLDYTINVPEVLYQGVKFDNVELNNQYYVLLINVEDKLKLDKVFQGGYRISTRAKTFTDKNNKTWHAYYPSVPTTGNYTFLYKLIREE